MLVEVVVGHGLPMLQGQWQLDGFNFELRENEKELVRI